LQPVADSSNNQNIIYGNPDLKPSITQNINLSYNSFNLITGKVLFTNFNFSTIKNQIITNSILFPTGNRESRPENVNGYYNMMGFYTFSKPFKNRKYVFSLNGSANFNHNINLTNSVKTIGQNWILSQGFGFEYNLKEWLQVTSGVTYSMNDVKYKSTSDKPTTFVNSSSSAWILTNGINVNATKRLVIRYDLDYSMNHGLANNVSQNPVLMNGSIEQQLFKKKNGIIKFAAYDLFKQNTNISRSIYGTSIVDTRSNKLTRYFLLSFTYRIQKFVGQAAQGGNMQMGGGRAVRMF
jgi:hypothetical protein